VLLLLVLVDLKITHCYLRKRKKSLTPLERIREEFFETEENYVVALRIIVKVVISLF